MRKPHDIGGLAAGPVPKGHHPAADWARLATATFMVLSSKRKRVVALDELRRTMEDMGPALYNRLGYFERQCHALATLLVERGVLARAEIERRMARIIGPPPRAKPPATRKPPAKRKAPAGTRKGPKARAKATARRRKRA